MAQHKAPVKVRFASFYSIQLELLSKKIMLFLPALVAVIAADPQSTWECTEQKNGTFPSAASARWTELNCTGVVKNYVGQNIAVGPIVVHVATALVTGDANSLVLRPVVAETPLGLAKLHEMANQSEVSKDFIPLVGVNGGCK